MFFNKWTSEDTLSYQKGILDGDWPNAVEILERRLIAAEIKRNNEVYATPAQVASAESDIVETEDLADVDEDEDDMWCGGDHQGSFF
jgi:hypothetical protein